MVVEVASSVVGAMVVGNKKGGVRMAVRGRPRKEYIPQMRICLECGIEFPVPRKWPQQRFCSRQCGGIYTARRRYESTERKYPQSKRVNGKKARVYRLIMGDIVGRDLAFKEVVHHIDLDVENNSHSNLYLYKNQSEHKKGHDSLEALAKELIESGIVQFVEGSYQIKEV